MFSRELSQTDERAGATLDAVHQMNGLFAALFKLGACVDSPETIEESAMIRAIAARGQQLTSAAMSLLGDAIHPLGELRAIVAPPDL